MLYLFIFFTTDHSILYDRIIRSEISYSVTTNKDRQKSNVTIVFKNRVHNFLAIYRDSKILHSVYSYFYVQPQ